MNITVVGGSRGTGALVAQQAAAAGHEVRTVSRSLGASIAGVEQVALDATDAVALQPAVRGADAVIVTVGARAREGETPRTDITRSVIAAIATEGVRRLVVQSSYGVGDSYDSMPFVMKRLVVPLILKQALADHGMQEALLVDSGLDWTVLRPGGLTDQPATGRVRLWPGTGGAGTLGRVARADIASLLLACVADQGTIGHAYTIAAG
ncbi:MAG TPA: NAD(P)-binding oxidoreductase [Propionibacteriaceae bacterium]